MDGWGRKVPAFIQETWPNTPTQKESIMTTPTKRFRGSINTINETSFAVAYGDSQALILDAITMIGTERKARLQHAKGRLSDAFLYADTDEEIMLVHQATNYLKYLTTRRLDV